MKRILPLLLALLIPNIAWAGACYQYVVPYATISTLSFCLSSYNSAAANDNEKMTLVNNATFAAGDLKLNIDNAGEANIGTLPTDRGTCYSVPLSAAETTGKEGYVTIIDQTSPAIWTATCLEYRTQGSASAFFAIPDTNVTQLNGVSTSAVAELASVPGATPSLLQMVQWTYQLMRFKLTQTATTATAFKADSATSLGTSTTADDGVTFTRGKYN